MAIGERIRFIRTLRGMTQKYLGLAVGFPEKTADVRIAQYETGNRTPKGEITGALARVLDVSPQALDVPEIDTYTGLMHTLFTLEDVYGLTVGDMDGAPCLRLDKTKGTTYQRMFELLCAWKEQAEKLERGEITREDYNRWRYQYPEHDTTQVRAKVPSENLMDFLLDGIDK